MTTAHTPGPWAYGALSGDVFVPQTSERAGEQIAFVTAHDSAKRAANARLIAAAPDLLGQLQDALEFIEDQEDVVDGSYGVPAPNRAMSLAQQIRQTIAKAELA